MSIVRKINQNLKAMLKGQTMTEYALIMAAVAVVVYAGYQTMGNTVQTLLSTVDAKL